MPFPLGEGDPHGEWVGLDLLRTNDFRILEGRRLRLSVAGVHHEQLRTGSVVPVDVHRHDVARGGGTREGGLERGEFERRLRRTAQPLQDDGRRLHGLGPGVDPGHRRHLRREDLSGRHSGSGAPEHHGIHHPLDPAHRHRLDLAVHHHASGCHRRRPGVYQHDRAAHGDEELGQRCEGRQVRAVGPHPGCPRRQRFRGRRTQQRRPVLCILPLRMGLFVLPHLDQARRHIRRRGLVLARELHVALLVAPSRGLRAAPVLLPGLAWRECVRGW
mmetsp:Transcript_85253/g.275141  ORF Transcript_85253/g.275141 Transcript_85253/m.275141 type:complete len:273 (+) Transcript_85253:1300-2118(+)